MKNTIKEIYLSYIKTVWKSKFIFILFFWIFVSLIVVLEPVIFTKIITKIEQYLNTWVFDSKWTINLIIFWWFFIAFSIIIQYLYDFYFVWMTSNKNYVDECNKYTQKLIFMNYSDFLIKKQWSLYKILDRWTDSQVKFLYFFFQDILRSLWWIIIVIIIMFSINRLMTLIALSMVPLMIFLWFFFVKKVGPNQKELNDKWDDIFWTLWNLLSWFMLTKVLTLESTYAKDIRNRLNNILSKQLKVNKYWSISTIYTNTVVMISRILVLWFWVFFIINKEITFSELFLFFSYIWWIYFPLWFIFSKLREATSFLIAIDKLHNEFDNLDTEDIKTWKEIKSLIWNIEYKNVFFWYSHNKKILKDLSFKIKSGEKIAFVWNTWSWKSTIINLLLRFWDTSKWEILIDQQNITDISKKSIRNHIWIVTQDVSLFNDTIKNNLLFVKPDATKNDIEKCLKMAEASFVFDLENWIDTVIWERWLKLSWWEKQRLSIARLFLKNPEILILDEATSALDNKTEKLIQKALDKLMAWRTSIVIAHRLSTIQNADKIFVLEKWKIVEEWNYKELIELKSKFYELSNPEHLMIN